jgi:imidazole glycerol-phosphate synthase subunit HisH
MLRAMRTAIIDYDAGNLTSVQRACAHLGHQAEVVRDPAAVDAAQRVIFPGVGAAGSCMASLNRMGLDGALRRAVADGRQVLAICVGLQLLFERSEEDGGVPCLGILPGEVRRLRPADRSVKVPHMGWNAVDFAADEPLAAGLPGRHLYFVHGYAVEPAPGVQVVATAVHGSRFCAGVRRGNLVAFQFHPEKSGAVGLTLLSRWLDAAA